jgi:hypothetical protein
MISGLGGFNFEGRFRTYTPINMRAITANITAVYRGHLLSFTLPGGVDGN